MENESTRLDRASLKSATVTFIGPAEKSKRQFRFFRTRGQISGRSPPLVPSSLLFYSLPPGPYSLVPVLRYPYLSSSL